MGFLVWGPIKYLIVNILHRDATLTGRMQVYPIFTNLYLVKAGGGMDTAQI